MFWPKKFVQLLYFIYNPSYFSVSEKTNLRKRGYEGNTSFSYSFTTFY